MGPFVSFRARRLRKKIQTVCLSTLFHLYLQGGLQLCDYLLDGEPADAATDRARVLLGVELEGRQVRPGKGEHRRGRELGGARVVGCTAFRVSAEKTQDR